MAGVRTVAPRPPGCSHCYKMPSLPCVIMNMAEPAGEDLAAPGHELGPWEVHERDCPFFQDIG